MVHGTATFSGLSCGPTVVPQAATGTARRGDFGNVNA